MRDFRDVIYLVTAAGVHKTLSLIIYWWIKGVRPGEQARKIAYWHQNTVPPKNLINMRDRKVEVRAREREEKEREWQRKRGMREAGHCAHWFSSIRRACGGPNSQDAHKHTRTNTHIHSYSSLCLGKTACSRTPPHLSQHFHSLALSLTHTHTHTYKHPLLNTLK